MGWVGGSVGYSILRHFAPRVPVAAMRAAAEASTDTAHYFGPTFLPLIQGRTVLDFGCGSGSQAVEMAERGAARVTGIDIQPALLERARQLADERGVGNRCTFATETFEPVDVIVSKDAFEHYTDPAAVLQHMRALLKPQGIVLAAFGPTWLHPHGGHLFSVFPWSHLLFSEQAQMRWRADFKQDGARRFAEVEGGLNQLTIRGFERQVAASGLQVDWMETVPIRNMALLKHRWLREFGTSIVRCRLRARS